MLLMVSLISFAFLLQFASCSTPVFCAFVYVFSQASGLGFVDYEIHAVDVHIRKDALFLVFVHSVVFTSGSQ